MLPSTRWQSFSDIIKNRWSVLLRTGLILLLFALPLLIHATFVRIAVYEFDLAYQEGMIGAGEARSEIGQTLNAGNLMAIPLFLVFGIGLAGVLRIMRQLVWQESVFFGHDFKLGLKAHIREVVVGLLAIGISNAAMWAVIYDASSREDVFSTSATVALSVAAFVLVVICSIHVIFGSALYALPLSGMVKNAILLGIRTFFPMIAIVTATVLPWMVLIVPLEAWMFPVLVVLVVVVLPIGLLSITEYTFHVYDTHINAANHREIYRKGLWNNVNNQT
jgi:hypothetical protein